MRRTLLLLGVAFLFFPAIAQNTLTIHQKDGQQFSFGFAEKPVITYTENYLLLKTSKTEISYPLSTVAKLTFTDIEPGDDIEPDDDTEPGDDIESGDDTETGVSDVEKDSQTPVLSLDSYMVCITGAKSDDIVSIIDADGKILCSYKTDKEGCVTFSVAELSEGVYIIKSENLTCKILKK